MTRRRSSSKNKSNRYDPGEMIKRNVDFFNWIQEFSKRIVTITFFIFVAIHIFILINLGYVYYTTKDLSYVDVLIQETNTTFRDVIGGYIIKAAAENTIKIIGAIVVKYLDMKQKHELENCEFDDPMVEEDFNNE